MSDIKTNSKNGFTIVELLIVIVVIAILATVSIVAYSGIQDRVHDAAIKSDINGLVKKIRLHEADKGKLPDAGTVAGSGFTFPGISFTPSKESYVRDTHNLFYCHGLMAGEKKWMVTSRSKSGQTFYYTPEDALQSASPTPWSQCRYYGWDTDTFKYSYGYSASGSGSWANWTN